MEHGTTIRILSIYANSVTPERSHASIFDSGIERCDARFESSEARILSDDELASIGFLWRDE